MTLLEQIAVQILAKNPLEVRELVQAYLRNGPPLQLEDAPSSDVAEVRSVAAGVAELLAERTGQAPPLWANQIGRLSAPLYLVEAAAKSAKMRARVERESPEPLRKRNVFAPPGYLEMM